MKKIIAFDVDDCICQSLSFDEILCRNYMKNHGMKIDEELDFKTSHCMPKLLGLSEEYVDFTTKARQYAMKHTAMIPEYFAKEVIDKLKEKGFTIYIISSRENRFWNDDPKKYLELWLQKNEIKYDGVFVGFEDKSVACKNLNCEFMVEDNPNFVQKLNNQGIKTILIKKQYNKDYKHELNYMVYNLLELYNLLGEIYNFDSTDIVNLF